MKLDILLFFIFGWLCYELFSPLPKPSEEQITVYTASDILYLRGDTVKSESGLRDTIIKNDSMYSQYVEDITAFDANNPIQTILNQIDSQLLTLSGGDSALDSLIELKINEFGITDTNTINTIYEVYYR